MDDKILKGGYRFSSLIFAISCVTWGLGGCQVQTKPTQTEVASTTEELTSEDDTKIESESSGVCTE